MRARVVVRDNGAGMTDEVQRRLFEPFFSTKPVGQGTGLGLATSRAILLEHGGDIEISSRPGEGTRCEVWLPGGLAAQSRSVPPELAREVARSRILLVDDEPAIRSVVKHVLEAEGHEIAEAENAPMAVEVVAAGFRPDLVLLDRSMPGWPVTRAVTELRARCADAPIVFFTGQSVPAEEVTLVDGVLLKPLSVDELRTALIRWLRGST